METQRKNLEILRKKFNEMLSELRPFGNSDNLNKTAFTKYLSEEFSGI